MTNYAPEAPGIGSAGTRLPEESRQYGGAGATIEKRFMHGPRFRSCGRAGAA